MGVKKECSANIFSGTKQKLFAGKFVKSEGLLAMLQEDISFNVKWVEIRKIFERISVLWNVWSFLLVFVGFETFC